MKQLILLSAIAIMFSCNNSEKKNNNEITNKTSSEVKKNESSDNVKTKEDFLLTCAVDASNSLGGENREKVKQFCECAWEKSKGEYRGEIIANAGKLKKDTVLSQCYEQAK